MSWNDGTGRRHERSPGRFGFRLLVTVGWLLVIATAFAVGYVLARHDAGVAMTRIQALQNEAGMLSEQLAETKEAHVRLERAHLIDREAKRMAQQELAELQRERLELAKEVAYLQRLISADDAGVVKVKELALSAGDQPGAYHYRLILSQLVPELGRSTGTVTLKVVMQLDGEEVTRGLDELPGSSPTRHRMGFDYFQSLSGEIVLPENAEPLRLVVDIEPSSERLLRSSDAYLWIGPDDVDERRLPASFDTGEQVLDGLE
jgi:hypothetical protein